MSLWMLSRLVLTQIKAAGGGVSIGALAKNTDTANHPLIRQGYPLLTQAILAGALAPDPQHGDKWRQSDATDPLFILLRRIDAVQ